jgi:hypothetical protein
VKRPPWEVADIVRKYGWRFMLRFGKCLTWPQVKVLNAIERCRTAALGGHRDRCDRCGHQTISYNRAGIVTAQSARPALAISG